MGRYGGLLGFKNLTVGIFQVWLEARLVLRSLYERRSAVSTAAN